MTSEPKNPSNLNIGDQYTSEDTDQFTKFIQSCDRHSNILIGTDDNQHSSVTRAFSYRSSDDDVFEKLRGGLGQRRPSNEVSAGHTQHYANAETTDGYTSTDQEHFSSLMSFAENDIGSTTLQQSVKASDRMFSYSDTDQLCFEQLTPRSEQEEDDQDDNAKEKILVGHEDRDVGFIKIIEYDKIKSDRVKKEDRPNDNIKIRYFD